MVIYFWTSSNKTKEGIVNTEWDNFMTEVRNVCCCKIQWFKALFKHIKLAKNSTEELNP